MQATSPVFLLLPLFLVFATAYVLHKCSGAPVSTGRFLSIDGLRGYLAFFVFIHHASAWYFYLQTGTWGVLPSALYTNLGQTSVALFFMITGFLFYNKLLDSRARGIDWGKFFVSRLLRLLPLYLFALFCVGVIVVSESNGILHEPFSVLAKSLVQWLSFTALGTPDLNRFKDTWLIVAGVTWTLPYEWFFYLVLPMLALTVRSVPPLPYLILSVIGIVWAIIYKVAPPLLLAFGGGVVAALAVRSSALCRIAALPLGSVLATTLIVVVVLLFTQTYDTPQIMLLTVAFTLIAGGATLFGGLVSPVSRTLGEMAYSIYLLHGILLFVVIDHVVGHDNVRTLSAANYWIIIAAISPVMILVCHVTCRTVELPSMQQATKLTAWLRSIWKPTAWPA